MQNQGSIPPAKTLTFNDGRYLRVANNLSDLASVATARTNLGLVAGGAGDIWVEKAGDTMTGGLTMTNGAVLTQGNATTLAGGITMYANTTGTAVSLTAGLTYSAASEYGFIMDRLRLAAGRFDFDANDGKAEMRLDTTNTLFNIFNKGSFQTLLTVSEAGLLVGGDGSTAATQKLTVIGNYELRDSLGSPVKRIRFRTSGGDVDVEGAGKDIYWSVWSAQDYTGTQRYYMRWEAAAAQGTFIGPWRFGTSPFDGRHVINGAAAGGVIFNEDGADADTRMEGDTDANLFFLDASTDRIGFGTNAPGTKFEVQETLTITGAVTDGYAAALTLDPGYTAATAQTVTRHNYIDVQDVSVAGAGPAAVTNSAVLRFDAAAGTHKAVDGATTKTTPGGVDAWMKININGTLHYIPAYVSKTA